MEALRRGSSRISAGIWLMEGAIGADPGGAPFEEAAEPGGRPTNRLRGAGAEPVVLAGGAAAAAAMADEPASSLTLRL